MVYASRSQKKTCWFGRYYISGPLRNNPREFFGPKVMVHLFINARWHHVLRGRKRAVSNLAVFAALSRLAKILLGSSTVRPGSSKESIHTSQAAGPVSAAAMSHIKHMIRQQDGVDDVMLLDSSPKKKKKKKK